MEESGPTDAMEVLTVLKRPQCFLRLVSLIFSIVVASCISGSAWEKTRCQFNNDISACNYGLAVGILCSCTLIVFFIFDFVIDRISDVVLKKMVVFADIILFGLWAFLWFVCFCYLADSWRKTEDKDVLHGWDGMRAAIAFSFFSTLSSGVLAVLACLRYQQGFEDDDFMARYDASAVGTGGRSQSSYASIPTSGSYTGGPRVSASAREVSDTKPLSSDPAYQAQSY